MGYEQRTDQHNFLQFAGLNTRDSELALPPGDSPLLVNVDLHPRGAIRGRNGQELFSLIDGDKDISAIMRLDQPEAGTGWIYAIVDGVIWRTLYPGTIAWEEPTSTPAYSMSKSTVTTGWGRALGRYNDGSNEYAAVIYLPRSNGEPLIAIGKSTVADDLLHLPAGVIGDGTLGSGTIGYPGLLGFDDTHPRWDTDMWPTKMRVIALGRGARMHCWGFTNDRNMVAYSELDVLWNFIRSNVDDYTLDPTPDIDGGYYKINPGDGDVIISVVDMFDYTVIMKRHNIYIYLGDPGSSDWRIAAHYPVGCVSDRAWEKVGNDLLFWSEDGPRSLSAVQQYGDLAQSSLSYKISPSVKSIQPGNYERICSYHDIENERIVWFLPLEGTEHNDTALIYYYNENEWSKYDGTFCQVNDVEVIKSTDVNYEAIMAATFSEGVTLLQKTFEDVDEEIEKQYVTNWIMYGAISDKTRGLWLDVYFGDDGPDVTVEYQTDLNGEWLPIDRITQSIGGAGSGWGRFEWGVSAWGETGRSHFRYEINGLFEMIRFRFSKTSPYGFEVMGYRLEARMKGPRP